MDNLRWVLLLIGLGIVLLVYLFSRFNLLERFGKIIASSRDASSSLSPRSRREPTTFDDADMDVATGHDDFEFHVSEFTSDIPSVHHDEDEEHYLPETDWTETVAETKSTLVEDEIVTADIRHDDIAVLDDGVETSKRNEVNTRAEPSEPLTHEQHTYGQGATNEKTKTGKAREGYSTQDEFPLDIQPLVLVLSIMASEGNWFQGEALVKALEEEGLEYGDMQIFHYFHENKTPSVFSVANAVEPGTFDLASIPTMTTPGITLFSQLPGALSANDAFDCMLEHARHIAAKLHGKLCDDRRNALTTQRIMHYQDRIAAFNRELMLAKRS